MDYPADLQLAEFPGPEIKERPHWFRWFVFLRSSASDELHAVSNHVRACVFHHKMNVIGCDDVIEHAQTEALSRFEEPMQITAAITRKLEQKLSLMAAVGNVPDAIGQEVTIGARHRLSLAVPFQTEKACSKVSTDAFYSMFGR